MPTRSICSVFALVLLAGCAAQPHQAAPMMPSQASAASEPRELLPDEQIQQVLNRLTFGARPGDAAQVRAMGVDNWIDRQLHPERIPDPRADSLMSHYAVFAMQTPDIIRDFNVVQRLQRQVQQAGTNDTSPNKAATRREILARNPELAETAMRARQMVGAVESAKLARAVVSDRQLDEVMTDFWENHFSVYAGKGQVRLFLTDYDENVIRPRALGKFRDLLGAVAKSPAMLFFLDNWQSAADSAHPTLIPRVVRPGQIPPALRRRLENATPEQRAKIMAQVKAQAERGLNENYARELMELHTLGVDGGYTQKDVQEVARALTGWTFNRQTGAFVFNPRIHDAGAKVILGQKFPAGHGEDEGERVLDILAAAPQTAHFITTKLARHFVSDDPPPALVDRCANTFEHTQGDIRETLRCIITSPEFFSRAAYRAKVKTPFEVVASGLRALDARPDTTPRTSQIVARMGEPIFGHQTPEGWPDRGDAWMNTGAILNRINFGLAMAAGQVPGARIANVPQLAELRTLPREQQVDSVVKELLGGQVAPQTREVLLSGENPMLGKATDSGGMAPAMRDSTGMGGGRGRGGGALIGKGFPRGRAGQPPPGFGRAVNLQGLQQVVGLALGAPEFQRR